MAKEWILNQAMNRWGLNKKRSVGPVSELIRQCAPKTLADWEAYYFENVHPASYLEELGCKLYIKITEVIQHEVADVSEADCIQYIKNVVIDRTFQGYQTEIQTIYGQLQHHLQHDITPAPDEWDRLYNVDFYIEISPYFIGLQIKPITFQHMPDEHRWQHMQKQSHEKFKRKFGGHVFTVFSIKENNQKRIYNPTVVEEIQHEIEHLKKLASESDIP